MQIVLGTKNIRSAIIRRWLTTIELSGPTATPRGQVNEPASLPRVPNLSNTLRFCMYWCLDDEVMRPVSLPTSSELRRPLDALFPETPIDRARLNRDDVGCCCCCCCCCFPPVPDDEASLLETADDWLLPSASLFLGPYLFFK